MNWLHSILILAVAYAAVFFEAWFDGFRNVLGTQIDFLPALMVYAGLTHGLFTIGLAAVCGGLWFDSLSANPLGVSMLPLLLIGLAAQQGREWVASDHFPARFCMGAAASALQPLLVLFILLNIGQPPIALAMGPHDPGRRPFYARLFRPLHPLPQSPGLSACLTNLFPAGPGNQTGARLTCLSSTS
jgi:cell shape-determining protein MreD